MCMITTIILDIGQVLAEFGWKEYTENLGFSEEVTTRLQKATVLSKWWNEVDRGKMSDEQLIAACCQEDPKLEKEIKQFFKGIEYIVKEYDYAPNFIIALKEAGYQVYILSNYGKRPFSYARERFKFLPLVDGSVISYEVNYIKPEKEIYEILLKKYKLVPQKAVFLDDRLENVEAAKAFGIKGIQFTSLNQALKELQELGVTCKMQFVS